jgi:myo-inositol 2-dehydrogenase / D-chiro-inositol 1-dehydrogenase
MHDRVRVGFLGAGPVTQSVHLPALARMSELLEVVHVSDVDASVAAAVAARVGARSSTTLDELLADPDVEVVAICSPSPLHAEHVQAACHAGVKAVLCEKPFATSAAEAQIIAATSEEKGVPIIVGAMHTFDPAWLGAAEHWGALPEEAHSVRSSILMPGGTRFEDFATEVLTRRPPPQRDLNDMAVRAKVLQEIIYGLIIHDLPLVRHFAPSVERILSAEFTGRTWAIVFQGSGRNVHLVGGMLGGWKPEWRLEAHSTTTSVELEFTPSYVWAGSGRSVVTKGGTCYEPVRADYNGYEGEWRAMAALARGNSNAAVPVQELIDDLDYAVRIADLAAQHILDGASK